MSKGPNIWRIFVDESGIPYEFDPITHNSGEKYFTLVAVVMKNREYQAFKRNWQRVKTQFELYLEDFEIKSRDIRMSNPNKVINSADPPKYHFWKYGDQGKSDYTLFCDSLEGIVRGTNFYIISVSVNKEYALNKYPSKDILYTCFSDLWERIAIMHIVEPIKKSITFYDLKRSSDDLKIDKSYLDFKANGTWYLKIAQLSTLGMYKRVFNHDSSKMMGLQLADYCAYPVKRHIETGSYPFFSRALKPKLYVNVTDKKTGRKVYMGLKLSLSR